MRESLVVNGPFVAGVEVYYDAWDAADKNGIAKMPANEDILAGGHAICIVGYDDKKKLWKSRKLRMDSIGNFRVYRKASSHGLSI